MAPDEIEHRQWLASLIDFGETRLLVDLGCGDGRDLSIFAPLARSDARLIGLDMSEKKLDEARARTRSDARVTLTQCNTGIPLPLAEGSVDVAFSNNLLECIGDKPAFLAEVHRVLRPGGQVVFAHWDWDSQVMDGTDKDLIRRIVHAWTDWRQDWMEHADGWMGRRLWATFQENGLFEGTIVTRVLTNTTFGEPWFGHARIGETEHLVRQGLIGADEHGRLLNDVRSLAEKDRYFYSITGYTFVGKPRPSIAAHPTPRR